MRVPVLDIKKYASWVKRQGIKVVAVTARCKWTVCGMDVGGKSWLETVGGERGWLATYLSTKGNVLDQHMGDNHTGARD